MQINVSSDGTQASDVDNLRALEVHAPATLGAADFAASLGHLGRLDADAEHVWLDVEQLRHSAGARDGSWHSDFDAMISYAGSAGWLSEDRSSVRAHVVRH